MEHLRRVSNNTFPMVAGIGLPAFVPLPSKLSELGPRLVVDWTLGTADLDVHE